MGTSAPFLSPDVRDPRLSLCSVVAPCYNRSGREGKKKGKLYGQFKEILKEF